MGQKTSAYLTDDTAEHVKASGLTLGELIRRGLDASAHLEQAMRRILREELAVTALKPERTAHATARITQARQMIPDSDREAGEALAKAMEFLGRAVIAGQLGDDQEAAECAVAAEDRAHAALVRAGYPDPDGTGAANAGHEEEYA